MEYNIYDDKYRNLWFFSFFLFVEFSYEDRRKQRNGEQGTSDDGVDTLMTSTLWIGSLEYIYIYRENVDC